MASNGMNGTKAFQDTIAQYVMKRAENDPLVAVKLANPSKTMEQCCTYIIGEVKKSGCCGFTNDEIFGMAIHYSSSCLAAAAMPCLSDDTEV